MWGSGARNGAGSVHDLTCCGQSSSGHHVARGGNFFTASAFQASVFSLAACSALVLVLVLCVRSKKKPKPKPTRKPKLILSLGSDGDGDVMSGFIDITGPASPVMNTIHAPMREYGAPRTRTPATLRRLATDVSGSQSLPISQSKPPPATGTREQIYSWLVEQHSHALVRRAYVESTRAPDETDGDFDGESNDHPRIIRQSRKRSTGHPEGHPSIKRSNSLALDLTMFDANGDADLRQPQFQNSAFAQSLDATMFLRAPYENVAIQQPPLLEPRDSRFRGSNSSFSDASQSDSATDSDDNEQPGPYRLQSKTARTYENVLPVANDQAIIGLGPMQPDTGPPSSYENVNPRFSQVTSGANAPACYENVSPQQQNDSSLNKSHLQAYMNVDLPSSDLPTTPAMHISLHNDGNDQSKAAYENVAVAARSLSESAPQPASSPLSVLQTAQVSKPSSWYETTHLSARTDLPSPQKFTAAKEDEPSAGVPGKMSATTGASDGEDSDENTPLATMASGSDKNNTSSGQSASTTLSAPYATLKREDILYAMGGKALNEENEPDVDDYSHLARLANGNGLSNVSDTASVDTMPYGRIGVAPGATCGDILEGDYATVDQLNGEDLHDYDNLDKLKARQANLNGSDGGADEQTSHTSSDLHATESLHVTESDLAASGSELAQGRRSSRPGSVGKRSQSCVTVPEMQIAADSGLGEYTPYSTLSKASSDKQGHDSISSEVPSCVSSQHHTPRTNPRRLSTANQPTPPSHSSPRVSRGDGGTPIVPQSPRPQINPPLLDGQLLNGCSSPSLSQQSYARSGSESTPAVPPGEARPLHLRVSTGNGSSTQISRTDVAVAIADDGDDMDGLNDQLAGPRLLDSFEIMLDVEQPHQQQQHFLLGPAQPILITKHQLMLRTRNTHLTEDARSFCDEQDVQQPKTYL